MMNVNDTNVTLLNTSILTAHGTFRHYPVTLNDAKKIVSNGFTSAVGHASTAQLLTTLLGVDVPVNRISYAQDSPREVALVFKLRERAPEGVILTLAEIEAMGYDFSVIQRLD